MLSGSHKQNVTAVLNLYEMSYKLFRLTEQFIRNINASLSFAALTLLLVYFGFETEVYPPHLKFRQSSLTDDLEAIGQ